MRHPISQHKEFRCAGAGHFGDCGARTNDWQADGWEYKSNSELFFDVYCPACAAKRVRYQAWADGHEHRHRAFNLLVSIQDLQRQDKFFESVEAVFGPNPFLTGVCVRKQWVIDPKGTSGYGSYNLSCVGNTYNGQRVETDRRQRYLDEILKAHTRPMLAVDSGFTEPEIRLALWADWFTANYGNDPFGTGHTVKERWEAEPLTAKDKRLPKWMTARRQRYQLEAGRTLWGRCTQSEYGPDDPGYDQYCARLADQYADLDQEIWFRTMEAVYGEDPFGIGLDAWCRVMKILDQRDRWLRWEQASPLFTPQASLPLRERWVADSHKYTDHGGKRFLYEFVASEVNGVR